MTSYGFRVYGIPAPQGSKNSGVSSKTGKSFVYEQNSAALGKWRDAIVKAARTAKADAPAMTGPVRLVVHFWLPRPPSVPPSKRQMPHVKPDLDKLVRAVGDALETAEVFENDSQIVNIVAMKAYAVEEDSALCSGAWIVVSEIP